MNFKYAESAEKQEQGSSRKTGQKAKFKMNHLLKCQMRQEIGLKNVFLRIQQAAPTSVPVLFLGESGTGKKTLAEEIVCLSRPHCCFYTKSAKASDHRFDEYSRQFNRQSREHSDRRQFDSKFESKFDSLFGNEFNPESELNPESKINSESNGFENESFLDCSFGQNRNKYFRLTSSPEHLDWFEHFLFSDLLIENETRYSLAEQGLFASALENATVLIEHIERFPIEWQIRFFETLSFWSKEKPTFLSSESSQPQKLRASEENVLSIMSSDSPKSADYFQGELLNEEFFETEHFAESYFKSRKIPLYRSKRTLGKNIRWLATGTSDLAELAQSKVFYYPLWRQWTAFPIYVPNLQERRADFENITRFLLNQTVYRQHRFPCCLTSEDLQFLKSCTWTENITQLQQVLAVAVAQSSGGFLDLSSAFETVQRLGNFPISSHQTSEQAPKVSGQISEQASRSISEPKQSVSLRKNLERREREIYLTSGRIDPEINSISDISKILEISGIQSIRRILERREFQKDREFYEYQKDAAVFGRQTANEMPGEMASNDEINGIDRTNEINEIDKTSEIDRANKINRLNKMNAEMSGQTDNLETPDMSKKEGTEPMIPPLPSLDDAMKYHIEEALFRTGGQIEGKDGAAALLDINPHTLRARMKKLGVNWNKFRSNH